MMSSSRMIKCSSASSWTSLPEYLPKRIRSPTFTSGTSRWPVASDFPFANRHDSALLRLFLSSIGNDDPAFGLVFFFFDSLHQDAIT